MERLERLADLIRQRNNIEKAITDIIGRPALVGHVGEYIASKIFNIELEESATSRSIDGKFNDGALAGRTMNIKWYGKQENILDITPDYLPDYYLVLSGPKSSAASSRGTTRPWKISSVFLFESEPLMERLEDRGVKIGIATSVRSNLWDEAMIYTEQRNKTLILSDNQKHQLALFG